MEFFNFLTDFIDTITRAIAAGYISNAEGRQMIVNASTLLSLGSVTTPLVPSA